jgi:transposase
MLFIPILSDPQRQDLEQLTQSAVGRVAQRGWMVLWSEETVPVSEIAQRLHCQPKTVRKWLNRYQRSGCEGLVDLPRCGRPGQVTPVAEQAVFTQLNQPPGSFGYVFAIWTVATLCTHLASRCRLSLRPWLVRKLLHQLRYRFCRPKLAPRREDPNREVVHQHIGQKIAQASAQTAIVVEDETDIRLFPVLRKMWMRIGQQMQLIAPPSNQKRTIFGTIDIHTGQVFHRFYPRKRTLELIAFLQDLLLHYAGHSVLLILDHASIHKSKALRAWLADHRQLELVYLPKYAAHRDNPIEKLWWYLKGYVAANRCCRSMTELVAIIQSYFDQLTPERVFQLVA